MGFYFEKPIFFDSYYPRLLLFVSRHSVCEFKTGLPDLAGQLLSFSFNSEIHPLPSTAYLAPGGMWASVPAIWQRRQGHTSDSLYGDRPHTLRPTTSCTHEKQFGFLYCLTHTGFVFGLWQPQQAQGCAAFKNHIPERNSWDLWPSWSKAAAVLKQWPGIQVKIMGIFVMVETQSLHNPQLLLVPLCSPEVSAPSRLLLSLSHLFGFPKKQNKQKQLPVVVTKEGHECRPRWGRSYRKWLWWGVELGVTCRGVDDAAVLSERDEILNIKRSGKKKNEAPWSEGLRATRVSLSRTSWHTNTILYRSSTQETRNRKVKLQISGGKTWWSCCESYIISCVFQTEDKSKSFLTCNIFSGSFVGYYIKLLTLYAFKSPGNV